MGKRKSVTETEGKAIKESEVVSESVATKGGAQVSRQRTEQGRVYVQASFNNTIVTVTDAKGNVITWMSAGSIGFSGPKKATPFAASKIIEAIAEKVKRSGPSIVDVYIRGIGKGRDSAVRTLAAKGFTVNSIKDVTPIPHNGPKQRKVRRI